MTVLYAQQEYGSAGRQFSVDLLHICTCCNSFMESHPFVETSPKDPQELRIFLPTLKTIAPKLSCEMEQQRRVSLSKLKFHQNDKLALCFSMGQLHPQARGERIHQFQMCNL
nr:uncharacterized protein LOC112426560 isoform X3 [Macaca nemestrina]